MSSSGRRRFLQTLGLGGAGAALLGPLLTRFAGADDHLPRRFVFVVEGNGYEPVTVLTDAARGAIDASVSEAIGDARWWYRKYAHEAPLVIDGGDFASAPALGALAASPTVAAQSAVVFGLSCRIAGGGHSAFHGALASARTISGVAGGPTLDAWLAGKPSVRGAAPYDAVRLGVSPNATEALDFGTCAFAAGRSAPLVLRPEAAYAGLFGSVGAGDAQAAFQQRRSLLDFARTDVDRALREFSASARERAKLESYLAAVEELTLRHESVVALGPQLEPVRPDAPGENPLYGTDDPLDRFRAHLELATAALLGGLTNVAVVASGTGGKFNLSYPSVSPDVARHDLHHGSAASQAFRDRIHAITALQLDAVVAMADTLAATPEANAEGSMLDHTVIVYIGDNGEQHHSTASEFPVVLIGGRALGLQTNGRTLVYPGMSSDGHRQLSNLWNTLGYVAGEELDDFGAEGPSRRALGPLAELLA